MSKKQDHANDPLIQYRSDLIALIQKSQEQCDKELQGYLSKLTQIIQKQDSFLREIYSSLIASFDSDHTFTMDDLESDFADQYYFSSNMLFNYL